MEYWSTLLPQLPVAITIIIQWIYSIVALPELPLLPVTWACNLTASPHILPLTGVARRLFDMLTLLFKRNFCSVCSLAAIHSFSNQVPNYAAVGWFHGCFNSIK